MTSKSDWYTGENMGVMEIVLIVLGIIVFIGSFLLPAGKGNDTAQSEKVDEEAIRELVDREVEEAKSKIGDIVDETITYAMEKTERSMDRLTNEKMLAVNEYSDTVLEEINKNHKEVVFLYDMLNDKHENLKSTVTEASKKVSEVKQTVKDVEAVAREAETAVREVEAVAKETEEIVTKEKEKQPLNAEESAEAADFVPIKARKVEVIYQPPEESNAGKTETELPQKKSAGRPRAAKAVKVTEETDKEPQTQAAEAEVEVTLNASGRTGGRNSNDRILELHKKGKSNMAIAKELGLGIGEVKLVIDLFEGQ